MKAFFSKYPLFPFLFGINALLSFYSSYIFDASLKELFLLVLLVLGFIALIFGGSYLLLKNKEKSAVFTFLFSAVFFSFQNLVTMLWKFALQQNNLGMVRYWMTNQGQFIVFVFVAALIVLFFILIKKQKSIQPLLITGLNCITIALLLVTFFQIGKIVLPGYKTRQEFKRSWDQTVAQGTAQISLNQSHTTPDVYYIILDGFARSDVLQDLYHFDNTDFINDLKERGFYVAEESYTNYSQTRTSLASSLNMMYLDEVPKIDPDKTGKNFFSLYYMMKNNRVKNLFSTFGYSTVSFKSEYGFSDLSNSDIYIKNKVIPNEFTQTFLSSTAASIVINPLLYSWHRKSVNNVFDTLPQLAMKQGSQFTFAHISCPHPPFVFNADGSPKSVDRIFLPADQDGFLLVGTRDEYLEGYVDQINYIQQKTIEMVDQILDHSTEPFILILQADHGPGSQSYAMNLEGVNLEERMSILNAYYFYDQNYQDLYPTITPVNTFRLVLDQYFDQSLPLLENHHFYSTFTSPLELINVDDRLQK